MELFLDRDALDQLGQFLDGVLAGPASAHGRLANLLDQIEHVDAGLLAKDVADESPEQPDVVAGVRGRGRLGGGPFGLDRFVHRSVAPRSTVNVGPPNPFA